MILAGFEIAMQHAPIVRRCNSRGEFAAQYPAPSPLRKIPDAADQRCEIFAIDVFHRKEVDGLRTRRSRRHGRHSDGSVPEQSELQTKKNARPSGIGPSLGKELQGYGLAQLQIIGAVDLAHPAPAERRDDAEATGEEGARCESFITGRDRR